MIEVIKHGNQKFKTTCTHCNCEFTYEICDISPLTDDVTCPDCGRRCHHDRLSSVYIKKKDGTNKCPWFNSDTGNCGNSNNPYIHLKCPVSGDMYEDCAVYSL